MSKTHYDVIIMTPGSHMMSQYVVSLSDTIKELSRLGISYQFVSGQSSIVSEAREVTAYGSAVASHYQNEILMGTVTYNKLFWIDSDIEWTPEQFLKLYYSPLEIVSGIYLSMDRTPTFVGGKKTPYEILHSKEPELVDAAGFGFICIKSGVFESIPRPWFAPLAKVEKTPEGKEYHIPIGEDYSFLIKARDLGFSTYIDPEVKVVHYKTFPIYAEFMV